MLAVSPLSTSVKNERESQIHKLSVEETEFEEFKSGNLPDSIDFDDIFVGISDSDVLPDLEMDREIPADFSVRDQGHKSEMKTEDENSGNSAGEPVTASGSGSDVGFGSSSVIQGEEVESEKEESVVNNSSRKGTDKSRKSYSLSRNPPRKKKPKVDWTPELHRRFVQAVEKLGLDKAVPSRILEIMGVDTLTRHNIASHLQKYRSHKKHVLAREAEATSWSQRRQRVSAAQRGVVNPWVAPPTMGFPPVTPMPHFRPLYVWGHPSVDQSMMPMWPQHPSPPAPPSDPSFWHPHHQFRFPSPPVAGVPFPAMYNMESGIGVPARQPLPQPPSDVHPSQESIDAAIGDVLAKPWLPLPLGLKPPSIDTVMAELQRQGVPKVPPTSCTY